MSDALIANNGQNEMLLSNGLGSFTSMLLDGSANSRSVISGDYNGDDEADFFVANDGRQNELMALDPCAGLDGYAPSTQGLGCYLCPPYSTDTWRSVKFCELCPAGSIAPGPAFGRDERWACLLCAGGKYRGENDQIDQCLSCPAGLYAESGASSCSQCDAGRVPRPILNGSDAGSPGCQSCAAGQEPSQARDGCVQCPAGRVSALGAECRLCSAGEYANLLGSGCIPCLPGQNTNPSHTGCICDDGFYNASFGTLSCFERNFDSDLILPAMVGCQACPPCAVCKNGSKTIAPDYALAPHAQQSFEGLDSGDTGMHKYAFHCPAAGACLEHPGKLNHTMTACIEGHTGTLCGVCDEDWKGGIDKRCEKCGDTLDAGWKDVIIAISSAALLLFAWSWWKKTDGRRLANEHAEKKVTALKKKREAALLGRNQAKQPKADVDNSYSVLTDAKIMISTFQIIGNLPVVLDFEFPEMFQKFLSTLSFLSVDLFKTFDLHCAFPVGLYGKYKSTMFLPPIAMGFIIVYTVLTGREKIIARSASLIFFFLFLVYPTLVISVFHMLSCRKLDDGQYVHNYDYSVDCTSNEYLWFEASAVIMVFVYPLGIPLFFGLLMFVNRAELSKDDDDVFNATSFEHIVHEKARLAAQALTLDQFRQLVKPDVPVATVAALSDEQVQALHTEWTTWRKYMTKAQVHEVFESLSDGEFLTGEHIGQKYVSGPAVRAYLSGGFFDAPSLLPAPTTSLSPCDMPWWSQNHWWNHNRETFKFLIKDYKTSLFYWELVEYSRKLVLSGLLIFCAKGSSGQLCIGVTLSFFYFALSARFLPLASERSLRLKLATEAQLFVTFTCTLTLKSDLRGEALDNHFFGVVLVATNIIFPMIPFLLSVIPKWKQTMVDLHSVVKKGSLAKVACSVFVLAAANKVLVADVLEAKKNEVERRSLIDKLVRPHLQPKLQSRGLQWDDVQRLIERLTSLNDVPKAEDGSISTEEKEWVEWTDRLMANLISLGGPIQCKISLCKSRSTLEDALAVHGIDWTDALNIFESFRPVDKLKALVADPKSFLQELDFLSRSGLLSPLFAQVKLKIETCKLKSKIEPLLRKENILWEDFISIAQNIGRIDPINEALSNPETFLDVLSTNEASTVTWIAVCRLRPAIEPIVAKSGIFWGDILPILATVDVVGQLEELVMDPSRFLANLASATNDQISKQICMCRLRPELEPIVLQRGIYWDDVEKTLLAKLDEEELVAALEEDQGLFLDKILDLDAEPAKSLDGKNSVHHQNPLYTD
eukprot:SAG31_NODE_250_length_19098_cov_4.337123_8_plen_1277_part_00